MIRLSSLLIMLLLSLATLAQTADEYFKPVKYRNIGPFRGGRSVCGTGVANDPLTYYMGTTGGGLWKTTDAGQHWTNISDKYFKTGSVGAIASSESHPHILYCGMGEHAPRGVMTSYGDGVYKSVDAGKTWEPIGLEKTQHISRVVIHPDNPDVVWVAAQGALHGNSEERGVYKSTDGGKSWKKVLYVNNMTGASELSLDMNYPNVLYAAMWEHQRKPWKVISGGEGSGLYKSTDGGETWNELTDDGLPEEMGKMAVSVSRANSNKVYALIESDSEKDLGGLFVSNDAGDSWKRVSDDNRLTQRAWYYIETFADPNDENTVYVLSAPALRSIDGGKTWERITGTHGDYHDLWINPKNSKNLLISNDGGSAVSFNGGESWSTQANMPTVQIYRINADNQWPYNIYGGQQDNSSVRIPTLAPGASGITERHWVPSAGGESAFLAFDPENPRYVMGGSYLGTIEIMDMEANASTEIMAAPIQYIGRAARDMKYLFDWNAPIIWSKHEPGTWYHCAQKVLRTRDRGETWEEVSPDLTRDIDEKQGKGGGPYTVEAVGAENYGAISYMIESPHEKGVFYTGSNDGLVHISRDNGETWQDVTPKGLGETLVNAIDVSPHDPATVYIATTRYKFNDHTPALYKSTNYGETWTNISANIPYGSFTRVVREDQNRENLLYAGTEKGVYVSWNGGEKWEPLQLNLPATPITDLKVHQGDLIVATSGRGFWVLDDLGLLNQYNAESQARIYRPEDAVYGSWRSPMSSNAKDADITAKSSGVNPANGVVVYYELPELPDSAAVTLVVTDAAGTVVRELTSAKDKSFKKWDGGPPAKELLPKEKGLNRFVWDMRHGTMPGVPGVYIEGSYRGHKANPGTYKLALSVNGETYTTEATILPNPLFKVEEEQWKQYHEIMASMEANLATMHQTVNKLRKVHDQMEAMLPRLEGELKSRGKEIVAQLNTWDEDMVQRKSKAYDDVENFPNKFTADYLFLINQTESTIPRVNRSNRELKAELDEQWAELEARASEFTDTILPKFNRQLWDAGIGALNMAAKPVVADKPELRDDR